ncbi:unnamed protein product [Strongylus vulgaris]|uniref:Uncharacterized protein n=1 Tax=Strongylus vulgaris TaxID=40348 RepID=A0A3P7L657_STRVU|nr:unnamed protein product [Strongylus vulgaris]
MIVIITEARRIARMMKSVRLRKQMHFEQSLAWLRLSDRSCIIVTI